MNILASAGWLPAALGFDPFPFGLLTLIVSLEAIFLSIFVLVSQNRQSERDRIRTDLDYQVNVKAHVEIVGIVAVAGCSADRDVTAVQSRPAGPVTSAPDTSIVPLKMRALGWRMMLLGGRVAPRSLTSLLWVV